MSEPEITFSERALSFVLTHINVAKLWAALKLWGLKRLAEWATEELKRQEGALPTYDSVKVSVKPSSGVTDKEAWTGRP